MKNTESVIKINLIRWLEEKGFLENAVLINELPVANSSRTKFSRRVDIAVANGKLFGFEIKSEFDSLDRLEGQIELYGRRFDKVFVVCADKFTDKVLEMTNSAVAVIEFESLGNGLQFKMKRRGRVELKKKPEELLSFVNKKDILGELRRRKSDFDTGLSRQELYSICGGVLTLQEVRSLSLETLKRNYQSRFNFFMDGVKREGYKESLLSYLLSSPKNDDSHSGCNSDDKLFFAQILTEVARKKMRPIPRRVSHS